MDIALRVKDITAERLAFLGLCLTFFLAPLGTTPFLAAAFLTMSAWLASGRFAADSRLMLGQRWALPVGAVVLLHWAGLLYTSDPGSGLGFALKTHYWVFALAAAGAASGRHDADALVKSLLAGLAVASIAHIAVFTGLVGAPEKYRAGFINPITYGLLLTFGLVLLSHYSGVAATSARRLLCASGMLLYLTSLSLFAGAPGRTALLPLFAVTPIIVHNMAGRRGRLWTLGATVAAAGALFFLPVVQGTIADAAHQVSAYYAGAPDSPVGLRLHMWSGAMRIFLENPLFGVGTGGYEAEMARYAVAGLPQGFSASQPHNSFLYMAASFGLSGLAAIVWLFYELAREAWGKKETAAGRAALSFVIIMTAASLTDSQVLQVHSGMLLAMLAGLMAAGGPPMKRRENR